MMRVIRSLPALLGLLGACCPAPPALPVAPHHVVKPSAHRGEDIERARLQLIAEGYGPQGTTDMTRLHLSLSENGPLTKILFHRMGSVSLDPVAVCEGARYQEPGNRIVLFPYVREGVRSDVSLPVVVTPRGDARVDASTEMPSDAYDVAKYPNSDCSAVVSTRESNLVAFATSMLRAQGYSAVPPVGLGALFLSDSERGGLSVAEVLNSRRGLLQDIPSYICEGGEPGGHLYLFALARGPKAGTAGRLMFHRSGTDYLRPYGEEEVALTSPWQECRAVSPATTPLLAQPSAPALVAPREARIEAWKESCVTEGTACTGDDIECAQQQLTAEGYDPRGAPNLLCVHVSKEGRLADVLSSRAGSVSFEPVAVCDGARYGRRGSRVVLFPYLRGGKTADVAIPVAVTRGGAVISHGAEAPVDAYDRAKYPDGGCTTVAKPSAKRRARGPEPSVARLLRAQGFSSQPPVDVGDVWLTRSERSSSVGAALERRHGLLEDEPTFVCPNVPDGEAGVYYLFAFARGPRAHTSGRLMLRPLGFDYLVPFDRDLPLTAPLPECVGRP